MNPKVIRVAIIGPESTGKSTISKALAQHYKTKWAPEFARKYLEKLDRPYQQHDLLEMAKGQILNEDKALMSAHKIVFFDTNLEVIKVWSDYVFGNIAPPIMHWHKARRYDAYLLTNIDLPWEYDPLREHPEPEKRAALFKIYEQIVKDAPLPSILLSGDHEQRLSTAINFIDQTFKL